MCAAGSWSSGKTHGGEITRRGYQNCQNPDPADKARHDRIVALVESMLELNKKEHSGKLEPSEIERVEREIASTDAEIDNLVYDIYGVMDEERKLIEGG